MPVASMNATSTVARTYEPSVDHDASREQPHDEAPDLPAVAQEEERREQHEQHAGQHLGQRGRGGQAGLGELRRVRVHPLLRLLDRLVDLLVGEVQRTGPRPLLDLAHALGGVPGQLGHAVDELVDHQRERPGHPGQPADEHEERGERPRQAQLQQPADRRGQQRRQQQRDGQRDHHDADDADEPQQRPPDDTDHDQAPRPGGGDPQRVRHLGVVAARGGQVVGQHRRRRELGLDLRLRLAVLVGPGHAYGLAARLVRPPDVVPDTLQPAQPPTPSPPTLGTTVVRRRPLSPIPAPRRAGVPSAS
jgi:hypothetical protein